MKTGFAATDGESGTMLASLRDIPFYHRLLCAESDGYDACGPVQEAIKETIPWKRSFG